MKDGTCPKCGSDEVYAGTDVWPKRGPFNSNTIPLGFLSSTALDNYVCGRCGFVEHYVSDRNALRKIRENWTEVESTSNR